MFYIKTVFHNALILKYAAGFHCAIKYNCLLWELQQIEN